MNETPGAPDARKASFDWSKMEVELQQWKEARHWYARRAPFLTLLVAFMGPGLGYLYGNTTFVLVGMGVVLFMFLWNIWSWRKASFPCPYCGENIRYYAEVLILTNLRQCPHCRREFHD